MMQDFADRFIIGRYADDPLVHIYRCDRTGPVADDLWIPERVWERVRLLAAGYELHLLPLLDGSTDPVFLNGTQCRGAEVELRFLGEVVSDPVIEDLVGQFIALLNQDSHGTSKEIVGIEFP